MILITSHTNADFDSLSCMVAALRLYPGATLVLPGAAEGLLRRWMEKHKDEIPPVHSTKGLKASAVERLVCVDVSSRDRIGALAGILLDREPPASLHVFDHHPGQGDLAGEYTRVEEAGSCTAVMVRELLERGLTPRPFEATLFLLGIYEDTGFLTYPTTRPADFEAVLRCLEWGGALDQVARVLKRGFTEEQMRLLAEVFDSLETLSVGGVPVHLSVVNAEAYVPDLSILAHEILAMEGMEALFLLAYMENRVHIIARSRTSHVNVAQILDVLGGGGHPSAASAVVRGKTVAEVRALLLDELTSSRPVGLKARDIMNREFQRIAEGVTVRDAFADMNRFRVNALPVFRGDRLVGVVTRQEVDGALQHGLTEAPVLDFIISSPPLLPPDTPAEEVRRRMLEQNWRIALFGDSEDRVEGLLSRMNLFKALYRREPAAMAHRSGGQPSPKEIGYLLKAAFSPEDLALLREIGEMGEERGSPCLLVGGAVRDLLLGKPVKDVDFVVEGDAAALTEACAARKGGRVRAHRAFGTAIWIRPDGRRWDFATARAEYYEQPAALPTVAHAALYQDLYRRDFTLNTLALTLSPKGFGEILDLFGGVRDLKAGRIRVLHGLSFVEDPTRAFRAVRFAVKLGFTLPPETAHLIAATIKQGVFRHLSPKRVLSEVEQILSGPNAVEGLKAMEEHRLLKVFWPAFKLTPKVLETLYRVQQGLGFFETHFPETPVNRPAVYLMALTERLPTAELEAFRAHYPFSQETRTVLDEYRSFTWRALRDLSRDETCTAGCAFRALHAMPLSLALFLLAKVQVPQRQSLVRDYIVRDRFTALTITGSDLLAAGVPPSPAVASALLETRVAKVDGKVRTREEELAFALKMARDRATAHEEEP
jgi:tRNA nucleotidyltransferase (CCA-adding enzyme)